MPIFDKWKKMSDTEYMFELDGLEFLTKEGFVVQGLYHGKNPQLGDVDCIRTAPSDKFILLHHISHWRYLPKYESQEFEE